MNSIIGVTLIINVPYAGLYQLARTAQCEHLLTVESVTLLLSRGGGGQNFTSNAETE